MISLTNRTGVYRIVTTTATAVRHEMGFVVPVENDENRAKRIPVAATNLRLLLVIRDLVIRTTAYTSGER